MALSNERANKAFISKRSRDNQKLQMATAARGNELYEEAMFVKPEGRQQFILSHAFSQTFLLVFLYGSFVFLQVVERLHK